MRSKILRMVIKCFANDNTGDDRKKTSLNKKENVFKFLVFSVVFKLQQKRMNVKSTFIVEIPGRKITVFVTLHYKK